MTMKNKEKQRNFGSYLFSERVRRKGSNLAEFLRKYHLKISETYYRDLETGRKLPHLAKAARLCDDLELDRAEFFFHLLKDMLPHEVFEELIKPTSKTVFNEAGQEIQRLNSMLQTYRKAHLKATQQDPHEVDETVVRFLDKHFHFLPLIHFIYMRQKCSFSEIEELLIQNGDQMNLEEALDGLEKHHLASVNRSGHIVQRFKRIFRIPPTETGIRFKDRFLSHEIAASLLMPRSQNVLSPEASFVFSGITCYNPDTAENIKGRVADLSAAFDGDETDLEDPGAMPFFITLIISPRPAYSSRNRLAGVNANIKKTNKQTIP
jgi:hypothetical protein